jgi:hypothetical protein
LEGVVESFAGRELQLSAELRARGTERLFKAALRLLPQLHRFLEFRDPSGRENDPLDPAVFRFEQFRIEVDQSEKSELSLNGNAGACETRRALMEPA